MSPTGIFDSVRPVIAQFLKKPNTLHWGFETRLLGEDEWGTWLAVPTGSRRWKGEEERHPTSADAVFLAPRDRWWHLHYNGSSTGHSHFVDIATPPVWVSPGRYEMIDLDLDVLRDQHGVVTIDDEDEFAAHRVELAYSDEWVERAVAETRQVVIDLEQGAEPFFDVAGRWLAGSERPGWHG